MEADFVLRSNTTMTEPALTDTMLMSVAVIGVNSSGLRDAMSAVLKSASEKVERVSAGLSADGSVTSVIIDRNVALETGAVVAGLLDAGRDEAAVIVD
jgi:ribosomal protein L18